MREETIGMSIFIPFFFGGGRGDGGEGEVNIFHTGYSEYINHQ